MEDLLAPILTALVGAMVLVIGAAAACLVAYLKKLQRKLEVEDAVAAAEMATDGAGQGKTGAEKRAMVERTVPKASRMEIESAVYRLTGG